MTNSKPAVEGLRASLGAGFSDWLTARELGPSELVKLDGALSQEPMRPSVMDWLMLEKYPVMPSEKLWSSFEASHAASVEDTLTVLRVSASPLELFALAPRVEDAQWNGELDKWMALGNRAMRFLAVIRSIEWIGRQVWPRSNRSRGALWYRKRVREIVDKIDGLEPETRSMLWWQLWGAIQRIYASAREEFHEVVRDICAFEIAKTGEFADPPPGAEWCSGNLYWETLIGHVAGRVPLNVKNRLVGLLLLRLKARLEGELHELPKLTEYHGLWLANCAVWAIADSAIGREWWNETVDAVVRRFQPWPLHQHRHGDFDRLAWLLAIGAAAAASIISTDQVGAQELARKVIALAEQHFHFGYYHSYSLSEAIPNLPQNLVAAARCLPLEEREAAIERLASRVTDAAAISAVANAASQCVSRRLHSLLRAARRERRRFELELNSDEQ